MDYALGGITPTTVSDNFKPLQSGCDVFVDGKNDVITVWMSASTLEKE